MFNILYVSSKTSKGEHYVLCEQCTRESDPRISEHTVVNQVKPMFMHQILTSLFTDLNSVFSSA